MKNPITAERLKQALANNNMTARELSNKSKVSEASISQYINGSHKPGNISAGKMAEVLNCSPIWLMGFDEDSKKATQQLESLCNNVFDIPIDRKKLHKAVSSSDYYMDEIESVTGIPLTRLYQILDDSNCMISMDEYIRLRPYWGDFIDHAKNASVGGSVYQGIMEQLLDIKAKISSNYYSEEQKIIEAYRNADDLTRAMVRRALGIEENN